MKAYPGFDVGVAVLEHEKFNFEKSFINHAIDGLIKAGVPGEARRT
ncbi:MAG TPA: hypothetical protein VLA52_12720 [Thermohalobaculum sp.]|nr:hypothetical protein [Thermohalobaculum sp.]